MNTLSLLAAAFLFVNPAASVTNRVAALPASAPRLDNPAVRVVNLAAVSPRLRAECGYYNLIDEPPAAVGVNFTLTGYERISAQDSQTSVYRAVYEATPIVAPVAVYDVSAIIYALADAGKWRAVKEALDGMGYLEAFVAAGTLRADFPGFDEYVENICNAADIDAETRAAILAGARVVEGL